MTFAALLGVLGTLGLVLGLFLLTARALRAYAAGSFAAGSGRMRLEIVQRIALGPKQGIAVVRLGERLVAVSLGDGGVQTLLEFTPEERAALAAAEPAPFTLPAGTPLPVRPPRGASPLPEFPPAVLAAVRTAVAGLRRGGAALALAGALGAGALAALPHAAAAQQVAAPGVTAQATVQVPAAGTAAAATVPRASAAAAARPTGGPMAVARVDTAMARLAPQMDLRVGQPGEGLRLSGTVGIVVMMGLLTLLPTIVLMMTGFTRILIVLHFLKQAIGAQTAPPAHLVAGLALLLTSFVMAPTISEINRTALEPWLDGRIQQVEMLQAGAGPLREFMLAQTRDADIEAFLDLSASAEPATEKDIPLVVLTSAFVTSELRTAFQIGFALFLPFIVIDMVVASVLMSMGMFMLPPAMIALPFKLLLFVLVDGWTLVIQGLVESFR